MYIKAETPEEAMIQATRELLLRKKVYGACVRFPMSVVPPAPALDAAFLDAFDFRTHPHFGEKNLLWTDFLIETVFPIRYWREAGHSIKEMLCDLRVTGSPSAGGKMDVTNSHFGYIATKRAGLRVSYVEYLLERWSDGTASRSMPHFHFDTKPPDWLFHDLVENPRLVKSWRTAVCCIATIAFRWDPIEEKMILTLILKHCNWSHFYGDVFGGNVMLQAFCRELGLSKGEVQIYAIGFSMDESKIARKFLEGYANV